MQTARNHFRGANSFSRHGFAVRRRSEGDPIEEPVDESVRAFAVRNVQLTSPLLDGDTVEPESLDVLAPAGGEPAVEDLRSHFRVELDSEVPTEDERL